MALPLQDGQGIDGRRPVDHRSGLRVAAIKDRHEWETATRQRQLITGVNWSPGIVNPFRSLGYGRGLESLLAEKFPRAAGAGGAGASRLSAHTPTGASRRS